MKSFLLLLLLFVVPCCECNIEITLIIIREKEGWHNPITGDFTGYLAVSASGEKFLLKSNDEFEIGDEIFGEFSRPDVMNFKHSGAAKVVELKELFSKKTTTKDTDNLNKILSAKE